MEIEKKLGSFGVGLSAEAMKSYNESCNWSKYISMVSDIRTVCPLNALAENFTKLYSDSFVSFYIAKVCLRLNQVYSSRISEPHKDSSFPLSTCLVCASNSSDILFKYPLD